MRSRLSKRTQLRATRRSKRRASSPAAGLIGLGYDLSGGPGDDLALSVAVDATMVLFAVVIGSLPWCRWPRPATLSLAVVALAGVSISHLAGLVPLATYGIWFVLIFVWIGTWHPPGTSYLMSPVALAALTRANVTDDLTGLGNRRRANSLLDSLDDGDALAILDLDHFKRVNDTLGHHRGDEVLQELGEFLLRTVRDHDTVARYGGEEFIVVIRQRHGAARRPSRGRASELG